MADQQGQKEISPRLLLLPAEIRLQIYAHLFSSTRLTHGKRRITCAAFVWMKPASNSLAILRSCRLINQEIGDSWLGQVLFAFGDVTGLLNKLSSVPKAVVEKVRHIRVGTRPLYLSPSSDDRGRDYRLAWALKLLPGLCLDTLTVINTSRSGPSYDTLDNLVKHGDGWRELYYIEGNSVLLGFASSGGRYRRQVQPRTWSRALAERDGVDSGACVKIYRSTRCNAQCSVINPNTRELFEQKPPSRETPEDFGDDEDAQIMRSGEAGKKLLVVVRRGEHANIVEEATMPFSADDIRQWSGSMSWEEIKGAGCWLTDSEGDEDEDDENEEEDVESDSYDDLDEYTFPYEICDRT